MTGGWRKLNGGGERNFFKFKDPGDELSGKWGGTTPGKYGDNGVILDKDGTKHEFTLNKKLEDIVGVEIGTGLRIVFLGERMLKNGNHMKDFDIFDWDAKREGSDPVSEYDKPVDPSPDGEDEVPF
tara:strand:+ start:1045 stop:1422 length:378 start_codon:yes stop_codon:yes gene_type:complete